MLLQMVVVRIGIIKRNERMDRHTNKIPYLPKRPKPVK